MESIYVVLMRDLIRNIMSLQREQNLVVSLRIRLTFPDFDKQQRRSAVQNLEWHGRLYLRP